MEISKNEFVLNCPTDMATGLPTANMNCPKCDASFEDCQCGWVTHEKTPEETKMPIHDPRDLLPLPSLDFEEEPQAPETVRPDYFGQSILTSTIPANDADDILPHPTIDFSKPVW